MRFSTVLSSLVMAAAGAFSFAYYMNGYEGVAFILGAALIIFGICQLISYVIGFRKSLLPEPMFIEGLLSVILGLLVIFDFVQEASLSIYFGLWFLTCGISRLSEALVVSKVNPSNWFAVLPLGMINTLMGIVMLLPDVLSDFNSLMVIAVCYILQAFSVVIYALYMVKRATSQKAQEAKERAEAKKLAAEEKRKERDRVRALSEAERMAEMEAARIEKVKEAEEKAALKAAKKEARREASDRTIEFTEEETKEIQSAAKGPAIWDDEYVDAIGQSAEIVSKKAAQSALNELSKFEEDAKDIAAAVEPAPEPVKEELVTRPVFNRPENIPIIEKKAYDGPAKADPNAADNLDVESKRGVMNLKEMEEKKFDEELPTIELPTVEIKAEGGEAAQRDNIIEEIKNKDTEKKANVDLSNLTPLTLEDLFADEKYNIKPLTDAKSRETDLRLTQTFTFDWLDMKKR